MSRINSEVLCDAFREEWMFQIEQAPSILTSPEYPEPGAWTSFMPIRADLARKVIEERVAAPLKLPAEEAAQGMLTILNENLIQAIRVISVERGFDPRNFTLVAFGGAGPLLASALARELGMTPEIAWMIGSIARRSR